MLVARTCQQQVLSHDDAIFAACHELPLPSAVVAGSAERLSGRGLSYKSLSGLPIDMPYVGPRVTGSAARSVH